MTEKDENSEKQMFPPSYPRLLMEDAQEGRFSTPRPLWRSIHVSNVQYDPKEKCDSVRGLAVLKTVATLSRERKSTRSMKKALLHLFMEGTTGG